MEFVKRIETLFRTGTAGGLTDRQLLERFLDRGGDDAQDAFAALVDRHAQWSYASAARSYPPKKTPKTPPRPRSWSWHVVRHRSAAANHSPAGCMAWHAASRPTCAWLSMRRRQLEHREGELRAAGHVVHGDFDAIENQDDWVRLHDELDRCPAPSASRSSCATSTD